MKFYDCATAPSPRRARMFIAEKGIEVETVEVSIAEGAHLSEEFRTINPRATVPVLVTDSGQALTENLGIAAYLEGLCPEPPLLGRTPEEKGAVLMWNSILEQQGGAPVADALRNSNPAMKGRALTGPKGYDQIPALAERGMARIAPFFEMVEAQLATSEWMAGEVFSLADITGFVFIEFARVVRMRVPEEHTATQAWLEKMRARPSAAL